MNIIKRHSNLPANSLRRSILKAFPALACAPIIFAQQSPTPVAVRKLHSFGLRVRDMNRSIKFYQDLFGAPIQARQGAAVCLRIGDGPRFFSLSPLQSGQQPGISHIGLSVENFDIESVRDQLVEFGVRRSSKPVPGQSALDLAMCSWVNSRGPDAGGSAAGTRELYFADIEGLVYQLSPEDHCGGSGAFGSVCENLEPTPAAGLFRTVDLSHFTNFLANRERGNTFYTRIFVKQYQAYQGPNAPVIGVGDGIQFLMYVGVNLQGQPSNPGRVDHVCFSVENFSVDAILASLTDYGLSARESAGNTQALMHWVSMRMPNRGGAEGGTPELYFSDPDGIRIQLQDAGYCGGGGYLGDACAPLVV